MMDSERIYRWSWAVLFSLGLSIVVVFTGSDGIRTPDGGRLGGDFPAFYGAATLVRLGRGDEIYSLESQHRIQRETGSLPDDESGHLIFAYPPFVAAALAPLSLLPFPAAYQLYTIVMILAWFSALRLLSHTFPVIRDHFVPSLALSLAFYPLFRGVTGGQNSALGLLCLAGVLYSINKPIRMGGWIGAWLFKAQYALLFCPLLLGMRAFRSFITMGIFAGAFYFLGASVSGWSWPSLWIHEGVLPFFERDVVANLHHFTTIRGAVLRASGDPSIAFFVGALLLGITLVAVSLLASHYRSSDRSLFYLASLLGALAPVVSLHGLFYDAALLVPALAVIASSRDPKDYLFVSGIVLLSWLDLLSKALPVQPTMILTLVVVLRLIRCHSGFVATHKTN